MRRFFAFAAIGCIIVAIGLHLADHESVAEYFGTAAFFALVLATIWRDKEANTEAL